MRCRTAPEAPGGAASCTGREGFGPVIIRSSPGAWLRAPPDPRLRRMSSEPPCNVILGGLLARLREDDLGLVELDELAQHEEGRLVRDARGLLHIVRHDDDRVADRKSTRLNSSH